MFKFYYQKIASGFKKKWRLFGMGVVELEKPKRALYLGKLNYIIAPTEEIARQEIQEKLSKKYPAFMIVGQKQIGDSENV